MQPERAIARPHRQTYHLQKQTIQQQALQKQSLQKQALQKQSQTSPSEDRKIILQERGVLTDTDPTLDDGSRYDAYQFEGTAGDYVRITLTSDDFDAVVLLNDLSGDLFMNDDDSGGGTNAELTVQLQNTGAYEVLANGFDLNERGRYELTVYTLSEAEGLESARAGEANRLLSQGLGQYQIGQFPEAFSSFESALDIYLLLEDLAGEAIARNNLGLIYQAKGNYEQALEAFEQSLAIAQKIENPSIESLALGNIGNVHLSQSNFGFALEIYKKTLSIAREYNNPLSEALALNNIGLFHQTQGDYELALNTYQRSLEIANTIEDPVLWITTTNNIATAHLSQGNYSTALALYQESLDFSREISNPSTTMLALGNVGNFYLLQASYAEALDYYQQSLELSQRFDIPTSETLALTNIGNVYLSQGSYAEALDYYQQSLQISQDLGARTSEILAQLNIGGVYMAQENFSKALEVFQRGLKDAQDLGDRTTESIILVNIGTVHLRQENYTQARTYSQQGLDLARTLGNRSIEALSLNSLGSAHREEGNTADAVKAYQQGLSIARELGDRAGEAEILANLGDLFERQDQAALAIVFFKQSVSTHEDIRNTNQALSQELKDAYTTSIEERYRRLADLLLQENRVLEAQQVLDLLRAQELEDYFQNVRSGETEANELAYWQPEEKILELYTQVLLAKDELANLRRKDFDALTAREQTRLQELSTRESELLDSFDDFVTYPAVVKALDKLRTETNGQNIEIDALITLQNNIANLPDAVLIYPLIFEDRLEIILVPPDAPPIRRPVEVSSADLNAAILDYRNILRSPRQDAEPAAQKLYQWLIAELEDDLAQLKTKTIIYAPDGALRYIPLAALHDGNQWLAERFAITHITTQSISDFDTPPSPDRRLFAGACARCSFTPTVNDESYRFRDLPFAGAEVDNLTAQIPTADVLVDEAFGKVETENRLGSYNLIHLATHGAFVSDSPDDSFLLFGDGEIATLREIRRWNLRQTDLVVLSACETGVGTQDLGSGVEVLGLGYQIQRAGAKAAIASLWQVNDNGTQLLMDNFYGAFTNGMPKAAAIQQAQLNLINGEGGTLQQDLRGGLAPASTQGTLPDNQKGTRHPHYWAPFILIGNGL
ncbi:MAG: tetratricopeptide repeat protein [Cyanobacteria bacterium J06623_4]